MTGNFTDGVVSKAIVEVNVLDVNDVCPRFQESKYTVYHTEPLWVDTVVAMTSVIDPDTVGNVTYTLTGESGYVIDSHGVIRTDRTIQTDSKITKRSYTFNVRVNDEVCSGNTEVELVLRKIVVNSYLFGEPYYRFQLSEFVKVGRVVHRFSNVGGHIGTYALDELSAFFAMNATTGQYFISIHYRSIIL